MKYLRRNSLRLNGFDYSNRRIYFITIVSENRNKVFLNNSFAHLVINCLMELRESMQFNLYCYCLMPDHIHLLIGVGRSNKTIGEICGSFKSLTTRMYWQLQQGKLWQRQFFDHIIRNEKEFSETIFYIKQNPVRKGLVSNYEQWPFGGEPDKLT